MTKTLAAASILAIAGVASAAPFEIFGYQGGGTGFGGPGSVPGIFGEGINTSGGGFFKTDGGSASAILSAAAGGFTDANYGEFNSYWGLDSFGPSARGTTNAANRSDMTRDFYGDYPTLTPIGGNYQTPNNMIVGPGSYIGDYLGAGSYPNPATPMGQARAGIGFSPQGPISYQVSGFAPEVGGGRSDCDGIFVGRFTLNAGESLSGSLRVSFRSGIDQTEAQVDVPVATDVVGGGVLWEGNFYALVPYYIGSNDIQDIGWHDGVDPDTFIFGASDTYDLWLVQKIPAPGALALFGLGGIAAFRRRRA